MTNLRFYVAVDPGKHACGVSIWNDKGQLIWAGYVKNPFRDEPGKERAERWGDMGRMVAAVISSKVISGRTSLILEIPQVYEGPQDEDRNDLIDLAGVQGAVVCATNADVEWSPQPREWKGQIKKEITKLRVDKRLSPEEMSLVDWPAKSLKHNVYDAIHLGLVFLEREGLREIPVSDRYPTKD